MGEELGVRKGYGSWPHYEETSVERVTGDQIFYAKSMLENGGRKVSNFGLVEGVGYLYNEGFAMVRRVFSENNLYPQVELFAEDESSLERMALCLGLKN